MKMNGVADVRSPAAVGFETFVERNRTAFTGFGVDRVVQHSVSRIVYAMCMDVCDDPIVAELHAVSKVSMVWMEIERNLSPSGDYLDRPADRLEPLRITGSGRRQDRWIDTLNLRQLRGWHAKGYGDFTAQIAFLESEVKEGFDDNTIAEFDLLATAVAGPGDVNIRGIWNG